MKANNRGEAFEVTTARKRLLFPFASLEVAPAPDDPVGSVFADKGLGSWPSGRSFVGSEPRRLGDRLLDQPNYRESVDRLLRLLQVLDRDVEPVVRAKSA